MLTDAELALMGLLAEEPRHGYDLERIIQERGVRNWTAIGHSSIYYLLRKLAARGLLEVRGPKPAPRTRATYHLTEQGERTMRQAALEAIAMPTPRHDRVLPGIAITPLLDPGVVERALDVRRTALEADLAGIETARDALGEEPAPATMLFDYGESMLRAELAWIERTVTAVRGEASAFEASAPEASVPEASVPETPAPEESVPDRTGGPVADDKYDVKRAHRALYAPTAKDFALVDVPPMRYLAIDGHGDPNTEPAYARAVEALYGTAYTLKFRSKKELGRDFAVAPLEGLWRADDPAAFVARDKRAWSWTMLISQPEWIDESLVVDAVAAVRKKAKGEAENPALDLVRLIELHEGRSAQILHVGSYDDEGPTLARLHDEWMPERGLTFNGDHHEIYLSDPRRTAPEKLKTILRQPVRDA